MRTCIYEELIYIQNCEIFMGHNIQAGIHLSDISTYWNSVAIQDHKTLESWFAPITSCGLTYENVKMELSIAEQ